MSERVVLVTGALAGIGRATATAFARQGAAVVVSGRRDEEGKALAELRELGADAEYSGPTSASRTTSVPCPRHRQNLRPAGRRRQQRRFTGSRGRWSARPSRHTTRSSTPTSAAFSFPQA